MKILICAGGTGSIALQSGLYKTLEQNGNISVDIKVLTNMYDNGKSTGLVRTVLDGKILGPSDLRKNQVTRLFLENKNSPFIPLLNIRFNSPSFSAECYCVYSIQESKISDYAKTILVKSINSYFECPLALTIDYADFSLANIVYAGLAKSNGNSMEAAATIMANLLGIKDNVLINDDRSLFLGAVSQSGVRVVDEGDIVDWGKEDDPFVSTFYYDRDGNESIPILGLKATKAIMEADIIILSSGTQWSSLIPTYDSIGFKTAIENSNARIFMVMNRKPDSDSPGQTASDIVNNIVPKYFPENRLEVIMCSTTTNNLNQLNSNTEKKVLSVWSQNLSDDFNFYNSIHDANKLGKVVRKIYFNGLTNSGSYVFDWDDTVCGRGGSYQKESTYNKNTLNLLAVKGINVSICTGNSIKIVPYMNSKIDVYADGAQNFYKNVMGIGNIPQHILSEKLNPDAMFHQDEGDFIRERIREFLTNKIENRGDVIFAIKPVAPEYRKAIVGLLNGIFDKFEYNIISTGRSTIEISKKELSKATALEHILMQTMEDVTYVGDECYEGGNDFPAVYYSDRIKVLSVKSPAETAYFISELHDKYYNKESSNKEI